LDAALSGIDRSKTIEEKENGRRQSQNQRWDPGGEEGLNKAEREGDLHHKSRSKGHRSRKRMTEKSSLATWGERIQGRKKTTQNPEGGRKLKRLRQPKRSGKRTPPENCERKGSKEILGVL